MRELLFAAFFAFNQQVSRADSAEDQNDNQRNQGEAVRRLRNMRCRGSGCRGSGRRRRGGSRGRVGRRCGGFRCRGGLRRVGIRKGHVFRRFYGCLHLAGAVILHIYRKGVRALVVGYTLGVALNQMCIRDSCYMARKILRIKMLLLNWQNCLRTWN